MDASLKNQIAGAVVETLARWRGYEAGVIQDSPQSGPVLYIRRESRGPWERIELAEVIEKLPCDAEAVQDILAKLNWVLS